MYKVYSLKQYKANLLIKKYINCVMIIDSYEMSRIGYIS